MPGSVTAPSGEFGYTPNGGLVKQEALNHCKRVFRLEPTLGSQSLCAMSRPWEEVPVLSFARTGCGLPVAKVATPLRVQSPTSVLTSRLELPAKRFPDPNG